MMRKFLLFTVLLLTLALLPTTPIAAVGPPQKGEEKSVTFLGPDMTSATTPMTVDRKGNSLAVYGNTELAFSDKFGEAFQGDHDHSLRITLKGGDTGEVTMGSGFDWYTWVDQHGDEHRVPHYWLEGSGTYTRPAGGLYVVTLEDVAIYEVEPKRKGKGAMEWQFVGPVWTSDSITFDMTIE